jgi:hypothetical protein
MTLPAYDVVFWHRSPSNPPDLYERILEKANMAPYESIDFDGIRDIHWGFSHVEDAIEFAEGFLDFAALEDVTKLTVLGESIGRKVYKDTMVLLRK